MASAATEPAVAEPPAAPVVHAMAPPPTEAANDLAILAPAADLPREVVITEAPARPSAPPEMEESERLFFATERPVVASEAPEAPELHARISRITSPEATRRRKKASTYVAVVFAGCALLVAFAAARGLLRGAEKSANAQPAATHVEVKGGSHGTSAPPVDPLPAQAPPSVPSSVTPSASAAAAPTVAASATPSADPTAASTAPMGTPDPAAAKVKKKAAQQALERGKLALAVEEGEAAVALDPEDGESWLILGAAYQEKGDAKKAREAFTSCLKLGKRGPKGECGAMLR